MSPEDASAKAVSFLSALRSGGASSFATPDVQSAALKKRVEELEERLEQALKAVGAPGDGEPPRAPTELTLFIQTRMELLERKLQEAQGEALRANLLLHEREAAQRRAQKEVEELFHGIREQQRASQWDAALREDVAASRKKISELEARLRETELKAIPAEDVLKALEDREIGEQLRQKIDERLRESPPAPPGIHVEPSPQPSLASGRGGTDSLIGSEAGTAAILLAKVAELEKSLEEVRRERDEERARRAAWEKDMVGSFAKAQERYHRSGSVELVVEAALQTMALAIQERDQAERELKEVLDQAAEQPPGSPADPVLRARIAAARGRLATLQETLRQQMNIVQAWIEQNKAGRAS